MNAPIHPGMAGVEAAFAARVAQTSRLWIKRNGVLVTETDVDPCEDCGDLPSECVCWMREVDADDRRHS